MVHIELSKLQQIVKASLYNPTRRTQSRLVGI